MRNKTTAGLLAILAGWIGVHKFYLGKPFLGIIYIIFFATMIPFIISLIEGIVLLSMSDNEFDQKYNENARPRRGERRRQRQYDRRSTRSNRRDDYQYERRSSKSRNRTERYERGTTRTQRPAKREPLSRKPSYKPTRKNPFLETGIKKYEDFDMDGALEDFHKALNIDSRNPKTHYLLACAYSLIENEEKSFYHLSKAVENGMKDLNKIKTQDELAFLRIQDDFENFEKAGFILSAQLSPPNEISPMDEDILLNQLNKLRELRVRGLLTEEEFIQEKRKLKA